MRMGDDYTSELTEFGGGGTYLGGPTRWGSVQGGHTWNRTTPQHTSRFQPSSNSYEAEDILYGGDRYTGISRPRSGLYYSPPGTSYTIVESSGGSTTVGPEAPRHHTREYTNTHQYNQSSKMTPRGTYLGATNTTGTGAATTSNSRTSTLTTSNNINKKRPISPEQVLRLFGNNGHVNTGIEKSASHANSRRSPASSPASTTHHNSTRYQPPSIHELSTRTVTMTRDPPDGTHGFGICVKGGKDAGVGVYISRVEEGSVAERAGLRPGDSILEVNGTPFTAISHEEALKMLKSCRKLSMTVRSPTLPGAATLGSSSLPGNFIVRQTCSWMDRQGRPVSPPLEYQRIRPWRNQQTPGTTGTGAIRRVDLCIEPGQSLGLMIRGGVEYNLGIFITGVDKDSVADRAGLLIGDQILEVNGQSFLDVTHDEAVNQLKFHKRMSLVVRDVGKVPHSCTSYDRGGGGAEIWDNQTGSLFPPSLTSGRKRNATLQMVEEKARCVLPKSDFPTLCYYTDEYICRRMTVDAFVAVMLELLNTPEKYTLLTELREIILPEDRVRFDELVYRREQDPRSRDIHKDYDIRHSSRRKTGGMSLENSHSMLMSSLHDIGSGPDYGTNENEDYRSPSEDSGLGLAMADRTSRGPRRPASATPGCEAWYGSSSTAPGGVIQPSGPPIHHRSSPPAITNTSDLDEDTTQNQEYGSGDEAPGRRSRRHSSPGDSRSGSATHLHQPEYDEDTELAHKLSRSFDMKDDQNLLDASGQDGTGSMRRHQSMQRLQNRTGGPSGTGGSGTGDIEESLEGGATSPGLATVVPDHQGNLRITVNKSKPILGIAIEGGANTKHPLPRIINIHENGAAFDAGGLEVGQLILEVDGQKVDGMQHQEVARLIAESFARRDRQEIEFLVVEAKKSNLEPKPTALIFLEA